LSRVAGRRRSRTLYGFELEIPNNPQLIPC
jgi:hypothetical protein